VSDVELVPLEVLVLPAVPAVPVDDVALALALLDPVAVPDSLVPPEADEPDVVPVRLAVVPGPPLPAVSPALASALVVAPPAVVSSSLRSHAPSSATEHRPQRTAPL
jgi:hypothetical protein